MAKTKTTFFCQNCGTQHTKWLGQCGACKAWNTLVEEVIQKEEKRVWKQAPTAKKTINKPLKVADIQLNTEERIVTNNKELDTVLGGGLVKGSVTLLGGEPGIGKSTLLLQVALNIQQKVLYVSGEESQSQVVPLPEFRMTICVIVFVLSESLLEGPTPCSRGHERENLHSRDIRSRA